MKSVSWLGLSLLGLGCSVEPVVEDSGGVLVERSGACPAGVVTLLSDFLSTQVALSSLEGDTLSPSFLSSASTQASGTSHALSGDVVLPRRMPRSFRVVLIDRYGTNVITWADPRSGRVTAQLPVGTGFDSNPQDYLEIDDHLAYVSRFGQNTAPGREAHDEGGDLLIVDTEGPRIIGRIGLDPRPAPSGGDPLPPRPGGMARVGSLVVVALSPKALDFSETGPSSLVAVDTGEHAVTWQLELSGLKNCGSPRLSPGGDLLAIACSGQIDPRGGVVDAAASAIVLLDAHAEPMSEVRRYSAGELAVEGVQSDVAFVDDDRLLFKTQTSYGGDANNRAFLLHLDTGAASLLAEASPDATGLGRGVVYGGLFCAPGCSDTCLMADADTGVLRRFLVEPDDVRELEAVTVEQRSGLPPRDLSGF